MVTDKHPEVTEQQSLDVAETARQAEWEKPSFMRELFLGRFRLDLIHPFPLPGPERPEFTAFYRKLHDFLRDEVDPAEIDRTGEYPPKVLDGLRRLGAFGMKIPAKYGGLGFTNVEYNRVMTLIGSHCGNIGALLSAHQSIGVPQPLKLFGTEELKKKYLPRCAAGEISAFALTEPRVGSDPARMLTTAVKTPDGSAYVVNGKKLWTTNGTLAKLLVVMAMAPRHEEDQRLRGRGRLAGGERRAPLPLHGPARHLERGDGLQGRAGARREPDRAGGQGPQDRAHHPQRRPPLHPEHLGRHGEGVPRASCAAGRTSACSGASRSASTRRSPTRSPTSPPAPSPWRR